MIFRLAELNLIRSFHFGLDQKVTGTSISFTSHIGQDFHPGLLHGTLKYIIVINTKIFLQKLEFTNINIIQ